MKLICKFDRQTKQYLIMAKLDVSKSIWIDAPIEKVFSVLKDFNQFTAWSPWLIAEPEAIVNVNDDATYYEWIGNRVGSGNMSITETKQNESIDCDLMFLKPYKSKAKVRYELVPTQNGTEVTWKMDSSLPFFLFWMQKSMTTYIGMDYERGLAMLKDYMEDGEVHSKLDFRGVSDFRATKYIGLKTNTTTDRMKQDMGSDFEKLWTFIAGKEDLLAGNGLSIYHKWDAVKDDLRYTAALPVKEIPSDLPSDFMSGMIPKTKVYTVRHTGNYEHLGNAWSTVTMMQRGKEFKAKKQIHPFEMYITDPSRTDHNANITDISFAIH